MRCLAALLITSGMLGSSALCAEDKPNGASHAKRLAPFRDEQVIAVVHVDLRHMEGLMIQIRKLTNIDPVELGRNESIKWLQDLVRAGGNEFYFVLGLRDFSRGPALVVPLGKGADAEAICKVLTPGKQGDQPFSVEVCERVGEAVFAGTKSARERLKRIKPMENADLAKAFAEAGDSAIQIALIASRDTRRAFDDSLPALPDWLGGGSPAALTRGALWGAAAIDVAPKMSVRVTVQCQDDAAARQASDCWARVVAFLKAQKETAQIWPNFEQLSPKLAPKVEGNRVTLSLDDATLFAFLQPALAKARTAATRARELNHLKQTGLALHSYHDTMGHFPTAANYDKNAKPLLSWRVHLLPYLDQVELYKQFKLDEPWDSEDNKKLIAKMPAVYQTNPKLEAGKTTLLGIAGERATFPGNKAVKIGEIRDGTANTIIVVDADDGLAVFWTQPDDYRYDPANPSAGLKGRLDGRFAALFADASVRLVSGKIDAKLLNNLFDRDDGQPIGEIP